MLTEGLKALEQLRSWMCVRGVKHVKFPAYAGLNLFKIRQNFKYSRGVKIKLLVSYISH